MMGISFNTKNCDSSILLCPNCGGNYLHHNDVTIYDRGEDGKRTKVISVSKGEINTQTMASYTADNPSARRHGLKIAFWCENCGAASELTIAQHKGETLVDWVIAQAGGRDQAE